MLFVHSNNFCLNSRGRIQIARHLGQHTSLQHLNLPKIMADSLHLRQLFSMTKPGHMYQKQILWAFMAQSCTLLYL